MKIKKDKTILCKVDGCERQVYTNELCSKHDNDHRRSGDVAGVYKITLKDKVYIGMSMAGVNTRISTERSRLVGDNPESISPDMLKYFNELCYTEPELSRKEIANKYFKDDILFSSQDGLKQMRIST